MNLFIALLLLAALPCAVRADAQAASPSNWELGAGYNFVHTNAPPSGCACFKMNGGSAFAGHQFTPTFSLIGEFNGATNGNINATGKSLTLVTYLAGPRYRYLSHSRFVPYGQIAVGATHVSGGLYAPSGSATGSANAFAAALGGGIDVAVSPRISIRQVHAEYLLTLLPN
jgi:peptidoglycan-associated lipoprotein